MSQTLVIPLVIGLVALVIGSVRRERMFKRLRLKQLKETTAKVLAIPEGLVAVQTGPLTRKAGRVFEGTLMLTAAGTPSLKRQLDTLVLLERAGLADLVGSILAYECTSSSLNDFANALPVVYQDRIVYASSRNFPNGFGNKPPEWVEGKIVLWGVELEEAVKTVVSLHDKRTGRKPGEIISFVSLGGHAFPGVAMTQKLHDSMPETQIVGVINLPRKTTQREYFLKLKERYEKAGVEAWLVSDQMQPDWVTQDSVVGAIFASLAAAALGSDGAPAINNVIANAAGVGTVGNMVRFTFRYTDVVAHPYQVDTDGTLRYFVSQERVESELLKVIAEIERGEGEVGLDVPGKKTDVHIYDIVALQLDVRIARDIRDNVERARDLEDSQLAHLERPHRHPSVDYETIYSSWSLPIDKAHPRCRILVTRLHQIDASLDVVVAAPSDRAKGEDTDAQQEHGSPESSDPSLHGAATTNGVAHAYDLDF